MSNRHRRGPPSAPPEEPFEQPTVPGVADAVELGSGPALKAGVAPVARAGRTPYRAADVLAGGAVMVAIGFSAHAYLRVKSENRSA